MSFIITRHSQAGDATWTNVSATRVGAVIARDLGESEPAKIIPAKDRTDAVQRIVDLQGLSHAPFPPTWEWWGYIYTIEHALDLSYPVELVHDDNGTILVTFPDVSGAITFGVNEKDALDHAVDALETMLLSRILDRKEIPEPSPAKGRRTIRPTLLSSLKVMLYQAMRERGWRKADLARALRLDPRQVDRLLDLRHASTVKQLEQALAACGKRADVAVRQLKAA